MICKNDTITAASRVLKNASLSPLVQGMFSRRRAAV